MEIENRLAVARVSGGGGGMEMGMSVKGKHWRSLWGQSVLHVDRVRVNILAVTLCFSLGRFCHWEKLGEEYMGSL